MTVASKTVDYKALADEQVVKLCQNGDKKALHYLINKYDRFVKLQVKSFFIVGASKEDLIQEGRIGLFKAIRDFKVDKECSFIIFAKMCILRHVMTAIQSATRQKHGPLNSYVSLDTPIIGDDQKNRTLIDMLEVLHALSPEEILMNREKEREIEEITKKRFTKLESDILHLFLEGSSYREIAERLNKSVKSIDNALQRIKKKARLLDSHTSNDKLK